MFGFVVGAGLLPPGVGLGAGPWLGDPTLLPPHATTNTAPMPRNIDHSAGVRLIKHLGPSVPEFDKIGVPTAAIVCGRLYLSTSLQRIPRNLARIEFVLDMRLLQHATPT